MRSYVGGWPEYSRVREERRAEGSPPAPAPKRVHELPVPAHSEQASSANGRQQRVKREEPSKNRLRELAKAEKAVEEAEAALQALEDELADPAAWATKYESAKSEARHTAAKRAVETAYERLTALVD